MLNNQRLRYTVYSGMERPTCKYIVPSFPGSPVFTFAFTIVHESIRLQIHTAFCPEGMPCPFRCVQNTCTRVCYSFCLFTMFSHKHHIVWQLISIHHLYKRDIVMCCLRQMYPLGVCIVIHSLSDRECHVPYFLHFWSVVALYHLHSVLHRVSEHLSSITIRLSIPGPNDTYWDAAVHILSRLYTNWGQIPY